MKVKITIEEMQKLLNDGKQFKMVKDVTNIHWRLDTYYYCKWNELVAKKAKVRIENERNHSIKIFVPRLFYLDAVQFYKIKRFTDEYNKGCWKILADEHTRETLIEKFIN